MNQTFWLICLLFFQILVFIYFVRAVKSSKTAEVRSFFIKGSFSFDDGRDSKVALCTYYNECSVREEAADKGLNLGDYLNSLAPKFNFETQPISKVNQKKYGLPGRVSATNKSLESCNRIVFLHEKARCIFVLLKPDNFGPYETCWIGTCVQASNARDYNKILKEFRKQEKC